MFGSCCSLKSSSVASYIPTYESISETEKSVKTTKKILKNVMQFLRKFDECRGKGGMINNSPNLSHAPERHTLL